MVWDTVLSLVRCALWGLPFPEEALALAPDRWKEVLTVAREQSVSGLVCQALQKAPPTASIPEEILFKLVSESLRIARNNQRIEGAEEKALSRLAGCHPVVMKGSRCAALYPDPRMREAGDVDLYIPEAGFAAARERAGEQAVDAPDGSFHYWEDDVLIDVHPAYFDLHPGRKPFPPVPSPEAELLMLSAHIFKHAAGPGTGLKQFCDFALALDRYPGDREALAAVFRDAGLARWERLLESFLSEYLNRDLRKGNVSAAPLLRIVRQGGNFGLYSPSRRRSVTHSARRRKWDTALLYLSRFPFSLRLAPRETLHHFYDLIRGNLNLTF